MVVEWPLDPLGGLGRWGCKALPLIGIGIVLKVVVVVVVVDYSSRWHNSCPIT